jgi:hypothetical protein
MFDAELISINEIERIEEVSNISSFVYGINSYGKSINIITKDKFLSKPFSQLRYSQDRSGSLYADVSFSIPLSKKFNFLIRANNHSLDGLYTNSNFSAWRADGRMSWFPSAKWNFKLDFNYAKISRGLNGGLNLTERDLGKQASVDSLRDSKAPVNDSRANEVSENYNPSLSIYSRALGSNSLTTIQLYYKNYYRDYGGKFAPSDTTPIYIDDYYNTNTFGINLKYSKQVRLNNAQSVDLTLLNNYYFNSYNPDYQLTQELRLNQSERANFGFVSGKIDYTDARFFISGLVKHERGFVKDNSPNSFSYGGEAKYSFIKNNDFEVNILGGANKIEALNFYPAYTMYGKYSFTNYESGLELKFQNIKTLAAYNYSDNDSRIKLNLDITAGKLNLKSENDFRIKSFEGSLPVYSRNDFSYRNKFFKDKLDLKLGLDFKFLINYKFYAADYLKTINDRFYSGSISNAVDYNNFNNKFLADAYIGARIGHANVNFTLANILNSFYYDTFLFPSDDRGGLGNVISRFTIVWDFIN